MSELLSCPFCGGKAEHATSDRESPILCVDCSASAVDAEDWNRRHTPDGWRLVPNQPTEAMKDSVFWAWNDADVMEIWADMLSAAPKPEDT